MTDDYEYVLIPYTVQRRPHNKDVAHLQLVNKTKLKDAPDKKFY